MARASTIVALGCLLPVLACSSGGGGGGPGGGRAGESADQALCPSSCAAFPSCGVTTKSTCEADCANASATYRTCVSAAGSDCNALALCYFQASAGDTWAG